MATPRETASTSSSKVTQTPGGVLTFCEKEANFVSGEETISVLTSTGASTKNYPQLFPMVTHNPWGWQWLRLQGLG